MAERQMFAKFPGLCRECGRDITEGAPILWAPGLKAKHVDCDAVASDPEAVHTPAPERLPDFSAVYGLFEKVSEGGKRWPAIVLDSGRARVKLYVSGKRSRFPGVVNVVDPDSRDWFGRIAEDGTWAGRRAANGDVEELLVEFAMDPVAVAAGCGRHTGRCCFCSRELTDDSTGKSVEMGYGPVCAKRWGLPWG